MYQVIIFTLGTSDMCEKAEPFQYVNRNSISAERLEYNLDHYYAWNGVIDSDGPAVAIRFVEKI